MIPERPRREIINTLLDRRRVDLKQLELEAGEGEKEEFQEGGGLVRVGPGWMGGIAFLGGGLKW